MSNNNKTMIPEAKEAMNKFKMEAASEVGVITATSPPRKQAPLAVRW